MLRTILDNVAQGHVVIHDGDVHQLQRHFAGTVKTIRAQLSGSGHVIAVVCDRGVELLGVMLGIFATGNTYLPIDPEYPAARIEYMLQRADARLVLSRGPIDGLSTTELAVSADLEVLCHPEIPEGDLPAYIIFTSGTTGQPKGAEVTYAGLENHLSVKIEDLAISDTDVVAQTASQCFDISLWQFLTPLAVGATLHIVPTAVVKDPRDFHRSLADSRASVVQFVPSQLQTFLVQTKDVNHQDLNLRIIATVGEPLAPSTVRTWFETYRGIPILNHYGPTECADGVTHHLLEGPLEPDAVYTPIGMPVRNMSVRVVRRDDPTQEVPPGETGELVISGVGVGRGYRNDPEKTRTAFFTHELWGWSYRTGDLGHLDDGLLYCHGRLDRQIKIRGHRIELGELEAAARQVPGIADAAAVKHTFSPARKVTSRKPVIAVEDSCRESLVLYLVWDPSAPTPERVRSVVMAQLKQWLPTHMLPDLLFEVGAFPKNSNGKLQYRDLPDPSAVRPLTDFPYRSPEAREEQLLADLFASMLRLDQVGRDDTFVSLGGDSLTATRLAATIAEQTGYYLAPSVLLNSSPKDLAVRVQSTNRRAATCLADAVPPATWLQKQLWFLHKMNPESNDYLLQADFTIHGVQSLQAVSAALSSARDAFDTLRVRIVERDGTPHLEAPASGGHEWPVLDISGLTEAERTYTLASLALDERLRGIDLSADELTRFQIIRVSPDTVVVRMTTHEIVMDAWSMTVLAKYLSAARGSKVEQARHRSLVAYAQLEAASLTRDTQAESLNFWRNSLSRDIPPLSLPRKASTTDATSQDQFAESLGFIIPVETSAGLSRLASELGASLFPVLLSAYYRAVVELSEFGELAVGVPHVTRPAEAQDVLGFFLNMIPITPQGPGEVVEVGCG